MSNPQDADKLAFRRYTQEEIDNLQQEALATDSEDEAPPDPEEGKVDESPNDASDQLEPRPASPDPPIAPPSAGAGGAAYIRRGMRVPARTEFRRRMLQRGGEGSVLEKMEKVEPGQARRLGSSAAAFRPRPPMVGAGGAGGGKQPPRGRPTPAPPFIPNISVPEKKKKKSRRAKAMEQAAQSVLQMPRTPPRSRSNTIDDQGEILSDPMQPPQPQPFPKTFREEEIDYMSDGEGNAVLTPAGLRKQRMPKMLRDVRQERVRLAQPGNIGYGFVRTPAPTPAPTVPTPAPTAPTEAPTRAPTMWGEALGSRLTGGSGELRRLDEARGREGRIMRMKPKAGMAKKRNKKN